MKREPKLSQTDYVARRGLECPYCLSEELEGQDRDFGGGIATLEVTCNDCDAYWVEEYDLKGYRPEGE